MREGRGDSLNDVAQSLGGDYSVHTLVSTERAIMFYRGRNSPRINTHSEVLVTISKNPFLAQNIIFCCFCINAV